MAIFRQKVARVQEYLKSGKYPDGSSRNEQRVLRKQAKMYAWNSDSKCLTFQLLVITTTPCYKYQVTTMFGKANVQANVLPES